MIPRNPHETCRHCGHRGAQSIMIGDQLHVECRYGAAVPVGVHAAVIIGGWPMPPAEGGCAQFTRNQPEEFKVIDGPPPAPPAGKQARPRR